MGQEKKLCGEVETVKAFICLGVLVSAGCGCVAAVIA